MRMRVGLRRAAAAVLGAVLFANAFPATLRDPTGVALEVSARLPARGGTVLEFPPFGELEAATHPVPVQVRLRLERLEPQAIQAVAQASSAEAYRRLEASLGTFLRRGAVYFAVRQAALAALGAAAGAWMAGSRGPALAGAAAAGAAGTLATAGAVAATLDVGAFDQPHYRGVLQAAPQLVSLARSGLEAVGGVSRRVRNGVLQLADLYARLQAADPGPRPERELVVAHVSDLHNNPAAYDLVEAVVRHFAVDLVIDTGDLADFDTPLETALMARLARLRVPYLLVPGNHDYPEALAELARLPGVRILDGEAVEVHGLRVLGVADPGASRRSSEAMDPEQARQLARRIETLVEQEAARPGGRRPDVVAVHNHRTGESLPPGLAPVVLFGHDHRARVRVEGPTVYVDAGSTGAEGLRGLGGPDLPFTLAIVRFDRSGPRPQPWAVDLLAFDGVGGQLSLNRYLAPGALRASRPAPAAPGPGRREASGGEEPQSGEPVPER